MLRKLTLSACLAFGLTAAQHAGAFTLTGPLDTWQTADLDFGILRYYYSPAGPEPGPDGIENGGPKNFGQGSRLTTPTLTYSFDSTFLSYFGSQGVAAVDSAMKVLNGLPSASSANLANFMTEGNEQINYTAQALQMQDLKSTVLWLMVEHMGLLGETHVFDLRARVLPAGAPACGYEYVVVNYNYDPVTSDPTPYVNGRLYNYKIWDGCPIQSVGATVMSAADTDSPRYSAVATGAGNQLGGFYLGLTRDDMGGLKFLYSKGNYAYQVLDPESVTTSAGGGNLEWMPVESNATVTASNAFPGGVLGGVEKISFVKVKYDSLFGTAFTPISYRYTIPYVTNSRLTQLNVTRTVTAPDILFTAADLFAAGPPPAKLELSRTGTFIPSPYVSPGGGDVPSTINPTTLIVLDNAGALYLNLNAAFMEFQNAEAFGFNWGTFDGSTNAPIVYPNGTSLAELEAQVAQGGGASVPLSPWLAVVSTNTTTTGTGGTGTGGAGAGVP